MKSNKQIIDKICKCLRLSESGNPNEASSALRQADAMIKKYGVSDAQILAAEITEDTIQVGERYNPPYWALSLATLIADAFHCRSLISRRYGRGPEFRFIGLGIKTEVATYSYKVLVRHLQRAISDFAGTLDLEHVKDSNEMQRREKIFAQAWLFRVGRTVSEFIDDKVDKSIIDNYIEETYGHTAELFSEPAAAKQADVDDILCGMRAANEIELYRSVEKFFEPQILQHAQVS